MMTHDIGFPQRGGGTAPPGRGLPGPPYSAASSAACSTLGSMPSARL